MWSQTNERFLDRRGCGDEFFLDADFKASAWLAGLHGGELLDDGSEIDELGDDGDDTAAH
jgi:hypothetical protein